MIICGFVRSWHGYLHIRFSMFDGLSAVFLVASNQGLPSWLPIWFVNVQCLYVFFSHESAFFDSSS